MQTGCPEKNTVPECIEYFREQDPCALCCSVRAGGKWLSYSRDEFWDYVCRYASLFARNLPEPTLVLFIKKLDIHLLAAYIGAMKAGHLPAQISPPTAKVSESEYRRRIDHIREITGFGALFIDVHEQARYSEVTQAKVFSSQMLPELPGVGPGFSFPRRPRPVLVGFHRIAERRGAQPSRDYCPYAKLRRRPVDWALRCSRELAASLP